MSTTATGTSLREKILLEAVDIVEKHGAEGVTMRSLAERHGDSPATITLYFPVHSAEKQAEKGESGNEKGTVLIIEDEEIILSMTSDFIKVEGYNVYSSSSGRKGIDLFARHQDDINLVLLDLMLPDMSYENVI